jgi:hypothetical protein
MDEVMIRIITTRNTNGSLTTSIMNGRNIEVARWENHNFPGEELETIARQFEADNPELFDDATILVDSAAESQKKNPNQYGAGNLTPIPER